MVEWKDKLLPASFRNVPFYVQSHTSSGGRKGVHHQYTGKDEETPEDLGKKARKFSFQAYVLGADYMGKRDALISAMEEIGVGKLVHPYLGTFQVSIDFESGFSVNERSDEGRIATFQLNFVKGAPEVYPAVRKNTEQAVSKAAATLKTSAAEDFKQKFLITSSPEFIRSAADADLANLVTKLQDSKAELWTAAASAFDGALQKLSDNYPSLGASAGQVAEGVQAVLSVDTVPEKSIGVFNELATSVQSIEAVPNSTGELATVWRKQQQSNSTAFGKLVFSNAIASMTEAASKASFNSFGDATNAMTKTVAHIDTAISAAPSLTSFDALEILRSEFVTHIQGTSADLAREVIIPNRVSKPALVLAYELYEDLDRAEEITSRNNITHPSKVSGGMDLEALNV